MNATRAERVQRDAHRDLQRALPDRVARAWQVDVLEVAGAVCTCVGSDPASAVWNRVVGLGVEEPVTPQILDAVESFYARRGAGFLVQGTVAGLEERGYSRETGAAVLERRADPADSVGRPPTQFVVTAAENGEEFGALCAAASELPDIFAGWFAALVGRDRWHCFLAREAEGGAPVATGALYAGDGVGYLGFAATHPERRGRGAQGALLSARLGRAHELGLSTVVADTAEPVDDRPGPSYRNLERVGFREIAVRPSWRSPV